MRWRVRNVPKTQVWKASPQCRDVGEGHGRGGATHGLQLNGLPEVGARGGSLEEAGCWGVS